MTIIDEVLKANEIYAKSFKHGKLPMPPAKKLAVLACMDARLVLSQILGTAIGDIHMIRNAGGIATEDAIRSLILSTQLLGTRAIGVIQHTQCGLMSITDEEFRWRLSSETGRDASHLRFHAFRDIDQNITDQVLRIRGNIFLPKQVQVRGYAYDVTTGALREVAVS